MKLYLSTLLLLLYITSAFGSISEYFHSLTSFFTSHNQESDENELKQNVPYELSLPDEKFISQALAISGVQHSELDSCQHRVVLKLQTACHKLNDEQLAKMAVALLNCQSLVEGRPIYPCTENMSIKECTIDMDADTWNTYHLMSNRARAVCYSIRQVQFRGITEQTVNKLMEAAKNQINTLGKISQDQENLQHLAENTLNSVSKGYKELAAQQEDLQKAQLFGQLSIEDNIKRLSDEKKLIAESQEQLAELTKSVHNRLEQAAKQLDKQSDESKLNHKELLDDMMHIQNMAQVIFQRIEDSSKILLEQSQHASIQYDATLKQLAEVNHTVHSLVNLMGSTKQAIDEKLNWITSAMGGTDIAIERLYIILWHIGFLLIAMIACAFLSARLSTRLFVTVLPSVNLALSIYENEYAQDALTMAMTIAVIVTLQSIVIFGVNMKEKVPALTWSKPDVSPAKSSVSSTSLHSAMKSEKNGHIFDNSFNESQTSNYTFDTLYEYEEEDSLAQPTPPMSRNGFYRSTRSRSRTPTLSSLGKSSCCARTRLGTPCKLNPLPGRDYCHRHQSGDSVMGS